MQRMFYDRRVPRRWDWTMAPFQRQHAGGRGRDRSQGCASTASTPVLTASEIGTYAFCPEAWYLQRHGTAQNARGVGRLEEGIDTHRRIGVRTGRLHTVEREKGTVLLVIVAIVAALILAQMFNAGTVHP